LSVSPSRSPPPPTPVFRRTRAAPRRGTEHKAHAPQGTRRITAQRTPWTPHSPPCVFVLLLVLSSPLLSSSPCRGFLSVQPRSQDRGRAAAGGAQGGQSTQGERGGQWRGEERTRHTVCPICVLPAISRPCVCLCEARGAAPVGRGAVSRGGSCAMHACAPSEQSDRFAVVCVLCEARTSPSLPPPLSASACHFCDGASLVCRLWPCAGGARRTRGRTHAGGD
jgi:hypothetical protein